MILFSIMSDASENNLQQYHTQKSLITLNIIGPAELLFEQILFVLQLIGSNRQLEFGKHIDLPFFLIAIDLPSSIAGKREQPSSSGSLCRSRVATNVSRSLCNSVAPSASSPSLVRLVTMGCGTGCEDRLHDDEGHTTPATPEEDDVAG